jgi:hypothetical protein
LVRPVRVLQVKDLRVVLILLALEGGLQAAAALRLKA